MKQGEIKYEIHVFKEDGPGCSFKKTRKCVAIWDKMLNFATSFITGPFQVKHASTTYAALIVDCCRSFIWLLTCKQEKYPG